MGVTLSHSSIVNSPNSVGPCDRQSALPLAEPGQWDTVKLYGWMASDHWTKWALLFFILCNQARGWWSVWIVKCWPQRYVSMEYLQSPHHSKALFSQQLHNYTLMAAASCWHSLCAVHWPASTWLSTTPNFFLTHPFGGWMALDQPLPELGLSTMLPRILNSTALDLASSLSDWSVVMLSWQISGWSGGSIQPAQEKHEHSSLSTPWDRNPQLIVNPSTCLLFPAKIKSIHHVI